MRVSAASWFMQPRQVVEPPGMAWSSRPAARWSTRRSVSAAAAHMAHSVTQEVMVNTAAPDSPAPTAQPPASMPPKPIAIAPSM